MHWSRLVSILLALVVVGLVAWGGLAWVGSEGAVRGWNADQGRLVVPAPGLVWIPRWSYQRSPGGPLAAQVQVGTREGVKVDVQAAWNPSPGRFDLTPAPRAEEAFSDATQAAAREELAAVPLACLAPTGEPPPFCPEAPTADLIENLAERLGADTEELVVTLAPDAEAVRSALLAAIGEELPEPTAKVLVLGFDGFDWDLVLPWVQAGRLPNLKRLMDGGTWGTMETLVPTLSPLIWTTIATGVAPDRHGILDFVERDPESGAMVPVTGRGRQVAAVWNIASAFRRPVGVVGWWASWPAERVDGVMASDRLYYTLTQGFDKDMLREDPPDLVYPDSAAAEILELRDRALAETDYDSVRAFQTISRERFDEALASDLGMEDPVDGFRRILASTRTYLGTGLRIAADSPDLLMVYLEGTDTIGHVLSQYLPPPRLEIDEAEAANYAAAVPRYFQAVDRWIGRYLEATPLDEYAVMLVSDHGFKWGDERPRGLSGTAGPTAPLWHENDAVFVTAGKGITALGRVEGSASIYHVAPSIVSLLGLPADDEWYRQVLPGVPAPTLEPIDYQALVPPASYRQEISGAVPVDAEAIAKLRALGYLGADGESAADATRPTENPAPPPPTTTPPESDGAPTRASLNNLAVLKINQGAYDEAEEILRRAIRMSPDYPSPHYNLRRIYMETERWEEADRELWNAVDKGLRDTEGSIDRAAQDYDNLDLPERSRDLLVRATERYPDHEPFWAHLVVVQIRLEECDDGNRTGREGASRFPNSAPIHAFWGLAAACAGDISAARGALERSLQIKPDQPRLVTTLRQLEAAGSEGG